MIIQLLLQIMMMMMMMMQEKNISMRKRIKIISFSGNPLKGINTWAVYFVRCLGPFFELMKEEIPQIDLRTQKL